MAQVQLRGDPLWNQPCLAYNIQAVFDAPAREQLTEVQTAVIAYCDGAMRPTPPHTFHISIFPIIPVRWAARDKQSRWENVEQRVLDALNSEAEQPVAVRFETIEARSTAIILSTADQPGPIARLRQRLNEVASAAELPTHVFDRTHVTLARPIRDATMEASTVSKIEAFSTPVDLRVETIRLVRETLYPNLELEVLA